MSLQSQKYLGRMQIKEVTSKALTPLVTTVLMNMELM